MRKVLIIDDVHVALLDQLRLAGFEVSYLPDIAPSAVADALSDAAVLVVRSKIKVTAELLQKADKLELIARAGSGMDNIVSLPNRPIALVNAPEGNAQAVAEHTLMLLLAMLNQFRSADASVRQFLWQREEHRGTELSELTVGIIGHGHVGGALAQLLQPFGCRILAYDKYKSDFAFGKTEACSYEHLMEAADVVTFHVPLTKETQQWMSNSWFQSLQKPIWLINAARGELVDAEALLKAIEQGRILGAALDVLPNEKLNQLAVHEQACYQRLFASQKVIFTPHIAGWTTASYRKISEVLAQKILLHFQAK